MTQNNRANHAVESAIADILAQRSRYPSQARCVAFCFPRIKLESNDGWLPPTPLVAAAAVVARNPTRPSSTWFPSFKEFGREHSIPSVVVRLNGVTSVEYHVSRHNMERLLRVGCAVVQRDKKGFYVRIPFDSPMYHGMPYSIMPPRGQGNHAQAKIGPADCS